MDLQVVDLDSAESGGAVVMIGGPCTTWGTLHRGTFEVVGAEIAQGRMTTLPVVPALDEIEDGHARFSLSAKRAPVDEFAFERGEETLGHGVIEAIAG